MRHVACSHGIINRFLLTVHFINMFV